MAWWFIRADRLVRWCGGTAYPERRTSVAPELPAQIVRSAAATTVYMRRPALVPRLGGGLSLGDGTGK
jgi:hypothetical protein